VTIDLDTGQVGAARPGRPGKTTIVDCSQASRDRRRTAPVLFGGDPQSVDPPPPRVMLQVARVPRR
jgi:hypothetical protein